MWDEACHDSTVAGDVHGAAAFGLSKNGGCVIAKIPNSKSARMRIG